MATPIPTAAPVAAPARSYAGPMVLMTTLFLLFGAVTNFNDVLMPYLKDVCQLSRGQSTAVQSAFFGAYFFMSLPAGWLLRRLGYQRGIVVGLLVMAGGALLFIPAADARAFGLFLAALALLGSGMTLLQVAANPYVSVLGPARRAAVRVSTVGVANNLGGTLSPLLGGLVLFGGSAVLRARVEGLPLAQRLDAEAQLVKGPYVGLAVVLAALALVFFLIRLPVVEALPDEDRTPGAQPLALGRTSALSFPHLRLGVLAIFLYVGVEVGLGSYLIFYGQSLGIEQLSGFTKSMMHGLDVVGNFIMTHTGQPPARPINTAEGFTLVVLASVVALYWLGSLVGRLAGIPLLLLLHNRAVLAAVCLAGAGLVAASLLSTGETALWLIVACGLMNALMWPIIFPLAITGLGSFTKQGSSYLVMAIVGGAVIPPLMGLIDSGGGGLRGAFLVPIGCYLYLLYYAVRGYRVR